MKRVIIIITAIALATGLYAEGYESMKNAPTTYYYTDVSNYTGDNGMSWRVTGALDSQIGEYNVLTLDPTVNGNGISGSLSSAQAEEGVGEVNFYVKGITAGTGYGDRTFRVTVGSVTKEVTVNIPSNKQQHLFTVAFKLRNVSSISITSVEMVSGETAKFGILNLSWTSYNGKTDSPVFSIDKTDTEIVVDGTDTTWYNATAVKLNLNSTTEGANIYYTTDGSTPTTSSTSGNVVSLSTAGTFIVKAMAHTASLGASDVVSRTITVGKGIVTKNDCSEAIWEGNYNINTTTSNVGESGKPVYTMSSSKPYTMTPALYQPVGLSLFAYASGKTLTISYQTGYIEVTDEEQWVGDSEWKDIMVLSDFDKESMKRFQIAIPDGLNGQYVRFKFTSSGTSVYADDINTIETLAERIAIPTLSIAAGEVSQGTTVTLNGANGALLHYSINGGKEQTSASAVALTIDEETVIRAYATKDGYAKSYTIRANYTISNTTDLKELPFESYAKKMVRDGQVLIECNGVVYTVLGTRE